MHSLLCGDSCTLNTMENARGLKPQRSTPPGVLPKAHSAFPLVGPENYMRQRDSGSQLQGGLPGRTVSLQQPGSQSQSHPTLKLGYCLVLSSAELNFFSPSSLPPLPLFPPLIHSFPQDGIVSPVTRLSRWSAWQVTVPPSSSHLKVDTGGPKDQGHPRPMLRSNSAQHKTACQTTCNPQDTSNSITGT